MANRQRVVSVAAFSLIVAACGDDEGDSTTAARPFLREKRAVSAQNRRKKGMNRAVTLLAREALRQLRPRYSNAAI